VIKLRDFWRRVAKARRDVRERVCVWVWLIHRYGLKSLRFSAICQRLNPHLIKRLFKNVSASCLAANASDYGVDLANKGARKAAKLERDSVRPALEKERDEKGDSARFHLRIISVRKRRIDPDNVSVKWIIDSLRFAGAIRDDSAEDITLEVAQRKCAKGEEEHTLLEVFRLSTRHSDRPANT